MRASVNRFGSRVFWIVLVSLALIVIGGMAGVPLFAIVGTVVIVAGLPIWGAVTLARRRGWL